MYNMTKEQNTEETELFIETPAQRDLLKKLQHTTPFTQLYNNVHDMPMLTREEEIKYGHDLKSNDETVVENARNHFIEGNMRLIMANARKYQHHGVPMLDLIQEGVLGIAHATTKYDVDRGFKFSTYATLWIKQYMRNAIIYQTKSIYVTGYARGEVNKLNKATDRLVTKLHRAPTKQEQAEEMHTTVKRIDDLKSWAAPIDSLDAKVATSDDSDSEADTMMDLIEDEDIPDPDEALVHADLHHDLLKVIDTLSKREELVVSMMYGLGDDHKAYSEAQIAGRLDLTKERVHAIYKSAIRHLRHPIRKYQLRQYVTNY